MYRMDNADQLAAERKRVTSVYVLTYGNESDGPVTVIGVYSSDLAAWARVDRDMEGVENAAADAMYLETPNVERHFLDN